MHKLIYSFGPFRLCPEQGLLVREGERVALGHRAFEILLVLVERAGEVVSTAEIVTRVWPKTIVDENNLRVHIASLRKVLSDEGIRNPHILNVPGRGYRFTAPVERQETRTVEARVVTPLPIPLTRLVGRDSFIRKVLAACADSRFVTVVGPGGMGKTSVALAMARELRNSFLDGCHFVDLSGLSSPDWVPAAIAEALQLQIPVAAETPLSFVVNSLRSSTCVIVLDSCEHVIDQAGEVVEAILRATSNVRILATSREPLRAEGESVYQLPALDIPPPADDGTATLREIIKFSAVELFAQRIAAIVDAFNIPDSDAPLIAELCRWLGGNPLAIELAAARVEMFGIAGLLDAIDDSLSLLTRGRRTAPLRHSTLRATLDWSFDLLSVEEKAVLRRLGVFVRDFTRESAVIVVSDEHLDVPTVIDALNNLVTKSLVAVRITDGQIVFRLFDLTRPYALEKLRDDPFATDVRRRHETMRDCVFASAFLTMTDRRAVHPCAE